MFKFLKETSSFCKAIAMAGLFPLLFASGAAMATEDYAAQGSDEVFNPPKKVVAPKTMFTAFEISRIIPTPEGSSVMIQSETPSGVNYALREYHEDHQTTVGRGMVNKYILIDVDPMTMTARTLAKDLLNPSNHMEEEFHYGQVIANWIVELSNEGKIALDGDDVFLNHKFEKIDGKYVFASMEGKPANFTLDPGSHKVVCRVDGNVVAEKIFK